MAENDIVAFKELASGGFVERALTPADISAAAASHTHTASEITDLSTNGNAAGLYDLTADQVGAVVNDSSFRIIGVGGYADFDTSNLNAARGYLLPDASGTLGLSEPADNVFRVVGSTDATKKVAFEVDGLTTATTRTLTVPDASGTLALTSDFASPPAIGNTTPAAGTFTTLEATDTSHTFGVSNPASDTTIFLYGSGAANRVHKMFAAVQAGISFQTGSQAVTGPCMASGGILRLAALGLIRWGTNNNNAASGGNSLELHRDAADDTLAQRRDANPQEARLYGTFVSSTSYQRMTVKSVKQTLSALSGASATTTGTLIPDGAVVVGVTTRVSTALTGATGYQVGDGTDADRWGDINAFALNTTSDNRDWTAGTIECFTAGGEVTLTANGGNFTAGAIEICVFYLAGEAD